MVGLQSPWQKRCKGILLGTLRPTRAVGPRWSKTSTPPKLTWADDPRSQNLRGNWRNATVIKSAGQALEDVGLGRKKSSLAKKLCALNPSTESPSVLLLLLLKKIITV